MARQQVVPRLKIIGPIYEHAREFENELMQALGASPDSPASDRSVEIPITKARVNQRSLSPIAAPKVTPPLSLESVEPRKPVQLSAPPVSHVRPVPHSTKLPRKVPKKVPELKELERKELFLQNSIRVLNKRQRHARQHVTNTLVQEGLSYMTKKDVELSLRQINELLDSIRHRIDFTPAAK